MLDFEEELKRFKPCLELEDVENSLYRQDMTDLTDILKALERTENKGKTQQ